MKNSSRFTLTFWILASAAIFEVLHASFMLDPNLDYCENDWYPGSCAQQKAQGGFKGTGKSANATNGTFVQLDNNELVSNDGYDIANGEGAELRVACFKEDKNACNTLIRNANLATFDKCDHNTPKPPNVINHMSVVGQGVNLMFGNKSCFFIGMIYYNAGYYHEAKPYFEKLCKDNDVLACALLGDMYRFGQGTRQDHFKGTEFYQKACNMRIANSSDNKEIRVLQGVSCDKLGAQYYNGRGVRQNRSIAKQYFGKACDLGDQEGCDNYKILNNQGVQ